MKRNLLKENALMLRISGILTAAALLAVGLPAAADTVHMKNGVQIDGVVLQQTAEKIVLDVDGRRVIVRAGEVRSIEKNDKTGALDRQKIIEEARLRDQRLTRITGLNGKQRTEVKNLMGGFLSNSDHERMETRQTLIAMAAEMDIFRFLDHCLPGLLPRYVPDTMTVMAELNPGRAKLAIRDELDNPDAACRARALELLGELLDVNHAEQMARGLLDHDPEVRAAAAIALARVNARKATPLLLDGLDDASPRARNACRLALERLWADSGGGEELTDAAAWRSFWERNTSKAPGSWTTARLDPLVEPGTHFQDE
jgi:hypothetical protein